MIFLPPILHWAAIQSSSPAQAPSFQSQHAWIKSIGPGLTFRTEWDESAPLIIYALRINTNCPDVSLGCDLAGHTVYENNSTLGRETVTQIVTEDKAIAGVNGDFFPFTGQPLNLFVRNGEILSLPYQPAAYPNAHRAIFGWGKGIEKIGYATSKVTALISGKSYAVDGLNQEAVPSALTLDDASAGLAYSKSSNAYALLSVDHNKWKPDDTVSATVEKLGTNLTKFPVKKGFAYLVGDGPSEKVVQGLKVGDQIKISIHTHGFDWTKIQNAVGGAPMLLQNGQININPQVEKVAPGFSEQAHPRTAIGYDGSGNIWLVTVDGRSSSSAGVTLTQLANIMSGLGCTNAMNLDGGGSSTFNVLGLTLNHPSDGVERPVAEGVLVFSPLPRFTQNNYKVDGPSRIKLGSAAAYHVVLGKGTLMNSAVLWKASGAAWIDQAGVLHPTRTGTAVVDALVHGKVCRFKVEVSKR